jgi:hypothetical protein
MTDGTYLAAFFGDIVDSSDELSVASLRTLEAAAAAAAAFFSFHSIAAARFFAKAASSAAVGKRTADETIFFGATFFLFRVD